MPQPLPPPGLTVNPRARGIQGSDAEEEAPATSGPGSRSARSPPHLVKLLGHFVHHVLALVALVELGCHHPCERKKETRFNPTALLLGDKASSLR